MNHKHTRQFYTREHCMNQDKNVTLKRLSVYVAQNLGNIHSNTFTDLEVPAHSQVG